MHTRTHPQDRRNQPLASNYLDFRSIQNLQGVEEPLVPTFYDFSEKKDTFVRGPSVRCSSARAVLSWKFATQMELGKASAGKILLNLGNSFEGFLFARNFVSHRIKKQTMKWGKKNFISVLIPSLLQQFLIILVRFKFLCLEELSKIFPLDWLTRFCL